MKTKKHNRKLSRKTSAIKFIILGAVILIVGFLSLVSFDVPFVSNGIYRFNSFASKIRLGIDLKGGIYSLYEADENDDAGSNLSERMDGTRTRLQNMLVNRGYTEATVTREGANRLRIEVPDVDDPSAILSLIGRPATLTIKASDGTTSPNDIDGSKHITGASVTSVPGGGYGVQLTMNSLGKKLFYNLTAANVGGSVSITTQVQGEQPNSTTVQVNEAISGGNPVISGNMPTRQAAQNLVDQIISGSFSVRLNLLQTDTISASLGDRALVLAVLAGMIGLLLVIVYLIYVYKLLGVLASIALLLYTVLMLFLLYFVPWVQLTLPGIAGVIISIAMAVDANIIVYERIKEEYRAGKSLNASINSGFKRAIFAVIDVNVTTVISGIVLLILGSGPVKGFAVVLLIGILVSMFSAVFISQRMLKWAFSITGDKPHLYGLKREDGVQELPDDTLQEDSERTKIGGNNFIDGVV
ncbi:MAG: protein translocase subunit SecD [Clostridiales bacterium]|jgi:protein-export SecD/SecF family membrane protein|nr:protein translocase subunit SecD [Clostridiales bacterium]